MRSAEGEVQVTVRDTGVGFEPQHMGRLFEPFYTTKNEGMGLGLSFVVVILDHHRATLEIESQTMRGTLFRIGFPMSESPKDVAIGN